MKQTTRLSLALIATTILSGVAFAGPVADFEKQLRNAYGDYRAALFMTNAQEQEKSAKTLGKFQKKWAAIFESAANPPPHYMDDPEFAATLSAVATISEQAAASIKAGKLPEAHEKLEAIREEIGELHARNGIITYSDRMNAYHAQMETVLTRDYAGLDATGLMRLAEDIAVLRYLAANVAGHPPTEAQDPDYGPLTEAFTGSVDAMVQAVQSGDKAAIKAAKSKLKPAYAKLFLKFG